MSTAAIGTAADCFLVSGRFDPQISKKAVPIESVLNSQNADRSGWVKTANDDGTHTLTFEGVLDGEYKKIVIEDCDNLQVADISVAKTLDFTTGDTEQDRQILAGIAYRQSCFDYTNCKDFKEMTENADYTGMSAVEKYKAVYDKYCHCYGEDFLSAFAISYVMPTPVYEDQYYAVLKNFEEEIAEVCGCTGSEAAELRREALYGENLSDSEVRNMIMDKYPPMGEITFRDFYKMTYEMNLVGAGGGINSSLGGGIDEIFSGYGGYYCTDGSIDSFLKREQMLDSKVTYDQVKFLQHNYECKLSTGTPTPPGYGDVIGEIMADFNTQQQGGVSARAIKGDSLAEMINRMIYG